MAVSSYVDTYLLMSDVGVRWGPGEDARIFEVAVRLNACMLS